MTTISNISTTAAETVDMIITSVLSLSLLLVDRLGDESGCASVPLLVVPKVVGRGVVVVVVEMTSRGLM